MELENNWNPDAYALATQTQVWRDTLASWVSSVFSPPILIAFGAVCALSVFTLPGTIIWLVFYVTMALVLPLGYTVYLLNLSCHLRKKEADRSSQNEQDHFEFKTES